LRITEFIGFSEDKKSLSFKAEDIEGTKQQIVFSNAFRNMDGIEMKPFMYEID